MFAGICRRTASCAQQRVGGGGAAMFARRWPPRRAAPRQASTTAVLRQHDDEAGRHGTRGGAAAGLPVDVPPRLRSRFAEQLPNSVSDGDNWAWPGGGGGPANSVSDHDYPWRDPLESERASVVAAEQRMLETLRERDPHGEWQKTFFLRSMGEQRSKAQRRPAINISLDEAWGRTNKEGELIQRPDRIVLVRHGESAGNSDEAMYTHTPDWRIPLTLKGKEQAVAAGQQLRAIIGDGQVFFYYSPYQRTIETLDGIARAFEPQQVRGLREEPRMAEQQFGNLQNLDSIRQSKSERLKYGRFFYRFPDGEAGLDVYSRVTSFMQTLRRDHTEADTTIVIVTHGLSLRLFLMAWFQWTVDEFETTHNPHNCGIAIMKRIPGQDRYRLSGQTCEMLNLPLPEP